MFESVEVLTEVKQPRMLVIGLFEGQSFYDDQKLSGVEENAIASALERVEWTGKPENSVETFADSAEVNRRILLVGLGKRDKLNAESLRKIAAALARRVASTKETVVSVNFAFELEEIGFDVEEGGRIVGETFGLLAWNPRTLRGSGSEAAKKVTLTLTSKNETFVAGMAYGLELAASVNLARDLSQTPPNIATPLWIAEQAEQLARETGMTCRVLFGDELETERLVGLVNVGKASVNPPCLIRLEYRPEQGNEENGDAPNTAPVVLIGKTITYDTGGLSLKVNNGMVGMKRDKDGGCAVLGAMRAIATLVKPDFPVVGLLVAAENSVSDKAFRPDDVLTYRNGVTVEVTNTDAEGRLVLADGLCWACEVEKADRIIDLATLTGGVVTALGSTYAGMFCDDDELRGELEAASATSGERVWRLPLHDEYRDMMKSPVADIINSNSNRKAHPIQGAAFLSYFVTEGTAWAHLDIAGVHAVDADAGPFVKGPTGWGVRLLTALLGAS